MDVAEPEVDGSELDPDELDPDELDPDELDPDELDVLGASADGAGWVRKCLPRPTRS